jgi:hypothetical protein
VISLARATQSSSLAPPLPPSARGPDRAPAKDHRAAAPFPSNYPLFPVYYRQGHAREQPEPRIPSIPPSFPFHGRRSIDPSAHVCTPAATNPVSPHTVVAAADRPRRRPFRPSPVSAGVSSATPLPRADPGAAYNGGGEGSRWRGTPASSTGEFDRWTPLEGIHSRARSNQQFSSAVQQVKTRVRTCTRRVCMASWPCKPD